MRNALNGQTLSYQNRDFLTVSMTRGDAQMALFDQAAWDKYGLAKLTNGKFAANSLIVSGKGDAQDLSIPALMKRGVIFMACHNAIWAASGRAIAAGSAGGQEEVAPAAGGGFPLRHLSLAKAYPTRCVPWVTAAPARKAAAINTVSEISSAVAPALAALSLWMARQ
jgi:hypothetical protein